MNEAMICVVKGLQEWIEARDGLSETPIACLHSTYNSGDTITIGDVVVWDSDAHGYDLCTIEHCKTQWLDYVLSLKPFWDESRGY